LNQENNQLISKSEAERKEFLTNLKHKLRTPMTVIKGYLATALESDKGEVSLEVQKCILEAYESNEQALKIVEDIK